MSPDRLSQVGSGDETTAYSVFVLCGIKLVTLRLQYWVLFGGSLFACTCNGNFTTQQSRKTQFLHICYILQAHWFAIEYFSDINYMLFLPQRSLIALVHQPINESQEKTPVYLLQLLEPQKISTAVLRKSRRMRIPCLWSPPPKEARQCQHRNLPIVDYKSSLWVCRPSLWVCRPLLELVIIDCSLTSTAA